MGRAFGIFFVIFATAILVSGCGLPTGRVSLRGGPLYLDGGVGAVKGGGNVKAKATVEEALAVFVSRCDELSLRNDPQWTPFVMENKLDELQS